MQALSAALDSFFGSQRGFATVHRSWFAIARRFAGHRRRRPVGLAVVEGLGDLRPDDLRAAGAGDEPYVAGPTAATAAEPFSVKDVALCVNLDQCNLRCIMCWTTYDRRHNADRHAVFDMPRDHLVALLESDELAEATVSVVGGGEPFLYPLIEDVLRLAPSERRRLMIMTNGTLLHKRPAFWEVAERARLSLMFSIDAASAATYEDVRRPGRWSVMLANLERCLEVRERNPELLIQTSFVVLRRNLHEVMDFMRLNARWRSTYVHFHAAMRGSYPDAWRVDPLDPAFARVMREALEFAAAHGIALDRPEELLAGVEEAASAPPADSRCSCRLHSEAMTVAHLGDVFVCDTAFRAGYRCGNVFRDGLRGAWESPAWTSLRRAHREGVPERHPLCRNCLLVR